MDFFIKASEVAVISGHNKYVDKDKFLLEFWKAHNRADYEEFLAMVFSEDAAPLEKQTKIEKVSELLPAEIKIIQSNTVDNLQDIKKTIVENRKAENTDLEIEDKLGKLVDEAVNKQFGTCHEGNVICAYNKQYGVNITPLRGLRKRLLYDNGMVRITLVGMIDGVLGDEVVEIKNRMYKLFYTLRDYEKVQVMCYMYLFDKKKCKLIEALKGSEIKINAIDVSYDERFMINIIESIKKYVANYCDFMMDDDRKISLVKKILH